MSANLPATTRVSTLTTEIGVLTDALSKASQTAIEKYIEDLNARGFAYPQSISPLMVLEEYAYALSGCGMGALSVVRRKLRAGEYEKFKGFMPTPSEFSALARAEEQKLVNDLVRAKETLEAMKPQEHAKVTPEGKARIKELLAQFRIDNEARKASGRGTLAPDLPLTPEREDELRRMLALKDADNITAERLAFRRRIEMKLAPIQTQEAAE